MTHDKRDDGVEVESALDFFYEVRRHGASRELVTERDAAIAAAAKAEGRRECIDALEKAGHVGAAVEMIRALEGDDDTPNL